MKKTWIVLEFCECAGRKFLNVVMAENGVLN